MKPSLMRKPPARAIASRSGTAQWCSIRTSAAAESFGISSRTSQASSSEKTSMPSSAAASAPAAAPASKPSSPSMPRPISAPTLLPSSIASSWLQVAQVLDLELALGVLVDGKRVDHADGVALPQALELGDDLAVEVRDGRSPARSAGRVRWPWSLLWSCASPSVCLADGRHITSFG